MRPALTLKGQLIGNAPTFTSTSGNISSRALTTASTAWTPSTWSSGSDYNSPDISAVVQEIVNQGAWASGNSLAIIITGRATAPPRPTTPTRRRRPSWW